MSLFRRAMQTATREAKSRGFRPVSGWLRVGAHDQCREMRLCDANGRQTARATAWPGGLWEIAHGIQLVTEGRIEA